MELDSSGTNGLRQLKAMLVKDFKQKIREWFTVIEMLFVCLMLVILAIFKSRSNSNVPTKYDGYYNQYNYYCDGGKHQVMIFGAVLTMFLVIGNSIVGTMVNDKRSGMKEMLTINGLTNHIYIINIVFQHLMFTILISLAVTAIIISHSGGFELESSDFC